MRIEGERFYHVHKHNSPKWAVGASFTFGEEPNDSWRAFEVARRGITNPETNEVFSVDRVAFRVLHTYRRHGKKDAQLRFYHYDPVMTLAETLDSLFLATRMVRELVLENVRRQMYPDLPSRSSCIWLIPEDERALRFWLDNMRGGHKKVFRVQASGELHRAPQQPVMGDTISLTEWRRRALDYWNGVDAESFDDELTLRGEVRVVEEVPEGSF
ncbi:MAG: DUF2441 domain-containing protein [Gammaproteobacteria bacterium]